MAKRTHHFTSKIKQHLSANKGLRQKKMWEATQLSSHTVLPNKLKLSIMRGETIYRQRFFDFFESKGFDDNFTYLAFQKMFINPHMLNEFFQHIRLFDITEDYIKKSIAKESTNQNEQNLKLYALLVDYLAQRDDKSMLTNATTDLVQHYLPSYFPDKKNTKPSLEMLKKTAKKDLNTLWHCHVTIKESFTTSDDSASIKLIAHVDGCYPTELIHIEAKRLRSAKFQAYHQLLSKLEKQEFNITPKQKKKN